MSSGQVKPDGALVELVLTGHTEAFRGLVERYERPALAVAFGVLGDCHLAQDAAQDAFLTAYLKLPRLRNRDAFGAWLLRIVRRRALRVSIRQRLWNTRIPASLPEPALYPELGQFEHLLGAVARLPRAERQMITLHYFEGHTVGEVAQIMNRPVGSITKMLSRARKRLGAWLEDVER